MPYTPPAAQSPAASRPETPNFSRSHSSTRSQQENVQSYATNQSSSKSYLAKHRRSPSITEANHFKATQISPQLPPSDSKILDSYGKNSKGPYSVDARSSRSDANKASPSASPPTSSDEEPSQKRGRERNLSNLAELQAAIRIIEQHRAGSPDAEGTKQARQTLGLPDPIFKSSTDSNVPSVELFPKLPLSADARKISHSRSNTESSAILDFSRNNFDSPARSNSGSEVEDGGDEEDLFVKPSLIRKKSGELVRPALRASSTRRRPSSMPGTPTYAKAVHFQENSMEHVRHFLQIDRPIAVSAGTSPVDSYDDEAEFPFGNDETYSKSRTIGWEIRPTNFPRNAVERSTLPIRTESIYLSPDTQMLMGNVAVHNISFHKLVVARFTLDYWKTTSEVVAEYNPDLQRKQANDGYDRFTFSIKLEDQANLENKTMYFCVRYNVNGQDYWDNNNSANYEVNFSKKCKPQNGMQEGLAKNARQLNALPRSKQSPSLRPRSMPSFEDFASNMAPYDFSSFPQPSSTVGDSPIRFRNRPSPQDIVPDAPGKPKVSSNQQPFGNRYDFGASLSAAIQTSTGDKSGSGASMVSTQNRTHTTDITSGSKTQPSIKTGKSGTTGEGGQSALPGPSKPAALSIEKPSLQSSSYHELLDKYCFVCSRSGKAFNAPFR